MAANYETFDSIVAAPQRFFQGENRVICISSRPADAGPVNQSPPVVFGGKTAIEKIKTRLTNAFKMNPRYINGFGSSLEELEKKFQALTGAKLELFSSLPVTAFPETHPFRSNGALDLLKSYQEAKAIPTITFKHKNGVFEVDPKMNDNVYVYFFQATVNKTQLESGGLHIYHSTLSNINLFLPCLEKYMFAMYDQEDNLWVSSETLGLLLTGHE